MWSALGPMNVGAGNLARGQYRRNVQITVLGCGRADAHALIGKAHVHGIGIGGRMHCYGGYAELFAGAQNPQCYLAAIGDQDLIEHLLASLIRHS